MRIALAQRESSDSLEENIASIGLWSKEAADNGADLIIFPEAATKPFGTPMETGLGLEEIKSIAIRNNIGIVYGAFSPAPDGRVHNILLALNSDSVVQYKKIHTYEAFGFSESRTVMPGVDKEIFIHRGKKIGLSICYDVRFPELYIDLAQKGAEIMIVSASWADGAGKAQQWDLLCQARALDSTSFLVAVDQPKPRVERKGPTGIGRSAVYAPDGQCLIRLGSGEELAYVDIDCEEVAAVRETIPVLANRISLNEL